MTPARLRRQLAKDFPVKRRVVVAFGECEEPGSMGECWMEGRTIFLTIAPADPAEQCWTLCHEWAHVLRFDETGKQCGRHTQRWAQIYAAIAQKYFPE